jgi:hypothetical protein
MNIESVVAELRQELGRIEQAIAALVGLGSNAATRRGPGRPAGSKNAPRKLTQKKHTMSASARAKISVAQKARWAKQQGKTVPKKTASKRKPMSPAMRKKLSRLMKARWAASRKTA